MNNSKKPAAPLTRSVRFFVSSPIKLVEGAEVTLNGRVLNLTDSQGSVVGMLQDSDNDLHVKVVAAGFDVMEVILPSSVQINRQEFIHLEENKKKWRPSKEWILKNLRSNIAPTEGDRGNQWLFSCNCPSWSEEDWAKWFKIAKERDYTYLGINIGMFYRGPKTPGHESQIPDGFAFPPFDFSNDLPRLQAIIDRCYENKILPVVCLYYPDGGARGHEVIKELPRILSGLDFQVALASYELLVLNNISDAEYTAGEFLEVLDIFKAHKPEGVMCIEFFQPTDREELVFSDRRMEQMDPVDWLKRAQFDVLFMELPQDLVDNFNLMVLAVGEIVARVQGPFDCPDFYPDGSRVAQSVKDDFKVSYVNKTVSLFEYGVFQKRSDEWKTDFRKKMQYMIPTLVNYGEG